MQHAAWSEIITTARSWRYDNYIAATLAPRYAQNDLIVITAFAGEIDRILMTVSEPTIAAIRLQWWRDAISNSNTKVTGNPLADMLCDIIHRHRLPSNHFLTYIDTQEIELYSDLAPDLAALQDHFVKRDGSLFNLAMQRLLCKPPSSEMQAISAIGAQAYGLARTLAQLPWRLKTHQFLLPADMAKRHAIWPGESIELTRLSTIRDELAHIAHTNLAEYRLQFRQTLHKARPALLPATLTELYLSSAHRHFNALKGFDLKPSRFARSWRILYSHWCSQI